MAAKIAKTKIKLVKINVGERVNYVMKDGTIRPLDVVRVWNDQGYVNGILLVDGSNDNGNIPFYGEGNVPTVTQSFDPHVSIPVCHIWATSVNHDESKAPGTWHFGETEVEEEAEEEASVPDSIQMPSETPQTGVTTPANAPQA